jgi:hypothetical protein
MNGGRIIAVDPLTSNLVTEQNTISPGDQWNEDVLRATILSARTKYETEIDWWRITSIAAMQKIMLSGLSPDSVYIDGNHHYAECKADIEGWLELVKPGGLICGHDYFPNSPGVVDAVNEVFKGEHTLIDNTRLWYFIKV